VANDKIIGGAAQPVYVRNDVLDIRGSGANGETPIQAGDTFSIDAFGRWRVSNIGERFDVEFIYNKQPDLVDEVTAGGGTATHDANSRDVTLAVVDANDTTEAALYSYDVPYTAGDGQLIDVTGTLNHAEIVGGEAFVFLRSNVTGTVVETTYAQSAWNKDTADSVDWSKSQICQMDFQSLKVGRIRFNLVRDGNPVNVHEITNDNIRKTGYWQLPSLPVYWRIYNDATYTYMEMGYGDTKNGIGFRYRVTANASATMKAICATVKTEGGDNIFDIPGFNRSIDSNLTAKTVSTTFIPLLSISPAATFNSLENRGIFIPTDYTLQSSNPIRYAILLNPTLTGASFTAVDATNSAMTYDVTASAVSGGIVVDSGYVAAGGNNNRVLVEGLLGRTLLNLGRTGTSDIFTIAAVRTTNSDSTVYSQLGWREIR